MTAPCQPEECFIKRGCKGVEGHDLYLLLLTVQYERPDYGVTVFCGDHPLVSGPVRTGHPGEPPDLPFWHPAVEAHLYPVHAVDRRLELLRGVDRHQLPGPYDRDPVAEPVCLLHVMRSEKDGGPGPVQRPQQGEDHLGALHVEPACRFVEEEKPGLVEEGHRKDEPLFHSLRVGLDFPVFAAEESEHPEKFGRTPGGMVARKPVEFAHQHQVLPCGKIRIRVRGLRHYSEPLLRTYRVGPDVIAGHDRRPGIGRDDTGQHPCRRGLARTVRSEEPEDLPLPDRKGYVINRNGGTEGLCQVGNPDGICHPTGPSYIFADPQEDHP